jgi:tight adherence protein C
MSSSVILWIGLAAVFLGIVGIFFAFAGSKEPTGVARSLAAVEAIKAAPAGMRQDLDRPIGERVGQPMLAWLTRQGRRLTPSDQNARMRRKLDLAGNPAGWDADRIIAFKMLGLIIGGVAGVLLPLLFGSVLWAIILGIGLAVFGFYLPNIVLYQSAYNRSDRILKDLPDALDLLVISVESGLGFDAALSQVARNTQGPLADEFFRVLQEMQLGTSRSEALRALADRTDVSDLRGFVTAMVQADTFGIPVANVLRIQAREMRTRRSQRAEEAAQKVPVKILFPLIFCILPVLFIAILGPAVIQIASAFSGV